MNVISSYHVASAAERDPPTLPKDAQVYRQRVETGILILVPLKATPAMCTECRECSIFFFFKGWQKLPTSTNVNLLSCARDASEVRSNRNQMDREYRANKPEQFNFGLEINTIHTPDTNQINKSSLSMETPKSCKLQPKYLQRITNVLTHDFSVVTCEDKSMEIYNSGARQHVLIERHNNLKNFFLTEIQIWK